MLWRFAMRRVASVLACSLAMASAAAFATETRQSQAVLAWSQLPVLPDPIGFAGPFAGVAGDALIVAGGANFPGGRPWDGHRKIWHDRIFALNEPDTEWEQVGKLPRPLAYGVSLTAMDGVVCLGGGDKDRHYADVFMLKWADGRTLNAEHGTMNGRRAESTSTHPSLVIVHSSLPSMPKPAAFFCGALLDQTVYVAGGQEQPDSPTTLKTFWALDLSKKDDQLKWQQLEPWPGRPRMLAAAAVQDGSFFLFSGVDLVAGENGQPKREYLKDAYRFAPGRGWKRIADLPRPAAAAPTPAVALGQSHILLLGGDSGEFAFRLNELKDNHPGFAPGILAYHTITDTWTKMGEMLKELGDDPANDPNAGVWPPVTTVAAWWRGRIVVPTGEIRPGVRTPRVLWAEPTLTTLGFGRLNYAVIVFYVATLVAMGVYFSRREKSTDDYFRGGRRVPWWAAGLSIFGTQLSAITFMAIPAMAYRTDWVYFLGNMMIVAAAPVVVWLYLPFYRRLDVTSAYEYLEKRFNLATRLLGSAAFILFQLGRMGVILYLPALALTAVTGINIYYAIIAMGLLATLYTVLGGIEAVIWTDVLQVVVLLGGALLSLFMIVGGVEGGLGAVISMGAAEGKFHAANLDWNIATTALWVVIVGRFLEQFVSYTSDQTVVQRYLTTADEKQAARSIWTNAVLAIPAAIIFFGLGTALWAFYRTHPHLLNPAGRTDDIFPWFIIQQLPAGVAGLVIAGLFAAAMSSLDSSMNSMATAITTDFYRRLKRTVSDRECLNFARVLTVLLGAAGTGFALYMAVLQSTSMWDQYTKIIGLFGGGLAGLFAAGVLTRRANGAGIIVGFAASAVVLYVVKASGAVHFFLYAGIGIATCVAAGWLASWLLPGAVKSIDGLTIYSVGKEQS
ncbi:hypothetical protein AMJ85_06665 [candidate division BRC1 bacterium SM23_51]|nr:MAG: hypothetical protein AMJ85_06665 [candidate division BRC1 bacterium SM23_51]